MQKESVLIIIGIIVAALLLLFAADLLGITGRAGGSPAAPAGKVSPPSPPPRGPSSDEDKFIDARMEAKAEMEKTEKEGKGWFAAFIRYILPAKPAIKEESPSPPPQPQPKGGGSAR